MVKFRAGGKWRHVLVVELIFLLLLLAVYGQAQAGQTEAQQKAAGESPATTPPNQQLGSPPATEEQKISPQEAEKLFRSVDEILQFASRDTLFPIKHEVKRQLVSRDQVEAYVNKHNGEDEDAKRLRRS